MNVEEIRQRLSEGDTEAVEEAWMSAAESDGPVDADRAAAVLAEMVAAGLDDQADALGWAMLEERKQRDEPGEVLALAKALAQAVPLSAEMRQQALELYRRLYGRHRHFDALVRSSELMNAQGPRRAFATLDLCLRIEDGAYLGNRFSAQVVQVRRFDETLGEYELEDLAGGTITMEPRHLADEFEPLDEADFRVLSRRDPGRLRELFFSDPATVLIGVCKSRDGRIDSVALKELLVPDYIEPDKWSSWWSRARTAAKRCGKLSVEGRNPIFLVYHPGGVSLEDEFAAEVESARTPRERLELLRRYLREARQRKVAVDAGFAAGLVDTLAG
ncbi:MAG: hypothetical protein J7M21_02565, partial [Planctomycetes bacterium]|nr:hypothetical protein [Planctomycetota bacterium]